jgi:hypothetical protein
MNIINGVASTFLEISIILIPLLWSRGGEGMGRRGRGDDASEGARTWEEVGGWWRCE